MSAASAATPFAGGQVNALNSRRGTYWREHPPPPFASKRSLTFMGGLMTEADLQQAVQELADQYGVWWFAVRDSRLCRPGWPDLVLVGKQVLFRELKLGDGRLTTQQRRVGYLLQAAGADWAVWRPADLRAGRIEAELRELST